MNATFTTTYSASQAGEQFGRLQFQAWCGKLWAKLTRREYRLQSLQTVEKQLTRHARSYAGIRLVPIAQIGGSEGRCDDFDVAFRPLKSHTRERWISVAVACSRDVVLPVVELVQVGETYFVCDGHHRISVAKLAGQVEIEAAVTVWHTDAPITPTPVTPWMSAWPKPLLALRRWLRTFDVKKLVHTGAPALQGS